MRIEERPQRVVEIRTSAGGVVSGMNQPFAAEVGGLAQIGGVEGI
jgi:hypothetical protein